MKTILLALTLSLCAVLPVSATQSPELKIRAAEATIRGLPTEHAIIFNSAGDIVARFDAGTADDVRISINGFAGDIMTHNHTLNVSFSTADVDNAREMGLSQLRVVEPDGVTCTLTATADHPFVMMWLTDDYPHTIDSIGAEDFNWDGVWRHYAALYGLSYGCSR